MKISKFGHSCLLIEESEARILVDPGAFSQGFEVLTGVDAVLITHQHPDHFVADNLAAIRAKNPEMKLYVDEGTAGELSGNNQLEHTVVRAGDTVDVKGVAVEVVGRDHATIHESMGVIPNACYLIASRFFHPGDSFTLPGKPVEVLALPIGAPWLKVSESIDYALAVNPKVAIPMHDAVLSMPDINVNMAKRVVEPAGIEIRVVPNGASTEV